MSMNSKKAYLFSALLLAIFIAPVCARAQFQTSANYAASGGMQIPEPSPLPYLGDTTPEFAAHNSIYLEIAGSAIGGALNYERMLSNSFGLRLGFGYSPLSGTNSKGATVHASITSAPLTLSWFPFSNTTSDTVASDKLEIGAGAGYYNLTRKLLQFAEFNGIGYTAFLGYRYQPWDGGFIFRIAVTPIILDGDFYGWAGISFGYGF
jgi:hypothetical protein